MTFTGAIFRKLLAASTVLVVLAFGALYVILGGESLPGLAKTLITIALLLIAGLSVLTLVFGRRLSARLKRLQAFSRGILTQQTTGPLSLADLEELGGLGQALNQISDRLGASIAELEKETESRAAILAAMTEGVLAIDSEMRVTFCNASFATVTGNPYPIHGTPPLVTLVRDPELHELLTHVIATREKVQRRIRISAPDLGIFLVHARPFGGSWRPGALAVLHDINELERLERVRKDFVTNVSHELRTPLSVIQGYAETLLDGAMEDSENNRKFIEVIRMNALRLNNIASDLLELSELESSEDETAPADIVQVREVMETALRTVAPVALARNVKLEEPQIEDVAVKGSTLRLEQALINLLANAIKFNRPDGTVLATARRDGQGTVEIRISDTGLGIHSTDLPRIFERFYRVDKARSRSVGGTGLGLAIVKHAVEAMRGRVEVESELGKGSRFTIFLPEANVSAASSQQAGRPS